MKKLNIEKVRKSFGIQADSFEHNSMSFSKRLS